MLRMASTPILALMTRWRVGQDSKPTAETQPPTAPARPCCDPGHAPKLSDLELLAECLPFIVQVLEKEKFTRILLQVLFNRLRNHRPRLDRESSANPHRGQLRARRVSKSECLQLGLLSPRQNTGSATQPYGTHATSRTSNFKIAASCVCKKLVAGGLVEETWDILQNHPFATDLGQVQHQQENRMAQRRPEPFHAQQGCLVGTHSERTASKRDHECVALQKWRGAAIKLEVHC